MKLRLIALAVALALSAPLPAAADRETADRLLREARAAAAAGRNNDALRAYNAAVEEDPGHPSARLRRGEFLLSTMSAAPDAEARRKQVEIAAADFTATIQADGESEMAAMARDRLTILSGRAMFRAKEPACDARAE